MVLLDQDADLAVLTADDLLMEWAVTGDQPDQDALGRQTDLWWELTRLHHGDQLAAARLLVEEAFAGVSCGGLVLDHGMLGLPPRP